MPKVQAYFTTVNSCLLSTEKILQQQLPILESDLANLTVQLHNTTETFDQKVDDVIQDLFFTIVDSSTFTSSLDIIIHNYLSTFHDGVAIAHSPHILQLQTAVQTLQNLTSSPSLTLAPAITHHIENFPTIV
jgi:hypothetical protein